MISYISLLKKRHKCLTKSQMSLTNKNTILLKSLIGYSLALRFKSQQENMHTKKPFSSLLDILLQVTSQNFFIKSAHWADSIQQSRCPCVSLQSPFHVLDFEAYFAPLPEVGCPTFLEIWNLWRKMLERSGLRIEHFCWEVVQNRRVKKSFFFVADFALQNMV